MSNWEPVLHSVGYAGAWPGHSRLEVEAFLDKAVELGYQSIALVAKRPHVSPLDYDPAARAALRQSIRERGLRLRALMGYTDFSAGLDRPGIPAAEMNAAYIGVLSRLAADLETDSLRIFTAYEREAVNYDQQYSDLVRGLKMAGAAAAGHGVTLLVQNHHDLAVHHRQLRWLLEEVGLDNVRCAFDAWAPHLQGLRGEELRAAVRDLGPWIAWTTVADYQAQPRFQYVPELVNYQRSQPDLLRAVPCGEGEVNYASFFAGLRDIGYSGPVAYEMCAVLKGGGGIENLDNAARKFKTWLAKL